MTVTGICRLALVILALAAGGPGSAQQGRDTGRETIFDLVPADASSRHVVGTEAGRLAYTATAGTIDLHDGGGRLGAKVFYTAYTLDDAPADRPITFAFNGGPGAASAYLHLGLAGPRIVELGAAGGHGATPVLRANPDSWLAFTDLVFIDPVGTGWSRAVSEGATERYLGVGRDAESLARVIALYVGQASRLSSPKYLLGESYGGFRAAKLATELRERQGIVLSGIVMISPFLEGHFLHAASDDPVSAALLFPSLAAAELERRGAFSVEALGQAEAFATGDYLVGLVDPPSPGAAADDFHRRISVLTGIPAEAVASTRGYLAAIYGSGSGDAGDTVSPYDAALAYPEPYPASGHRRGADPVLDGHTRAYGAAFAAYARDELNFDARLTYTLLNGAISRRWDWDGSRADASAMGDLVDMLTVNPQFRLMIMHGYSDAVTPFRVSEYLVARMPHGLTAGRVVLSNHRGGHMFYTDPRSRRAAAEDAGRFYRGG